MKVAVTGARGQLGTALLGSAPEWAHCLPISRDDCDLTNPAALAEMIIAARPDVIVNCAAYTAVDRAESEPELAAAVNSRAVKTLADAAELAGSHIIQVSTDFVFDGAKSVPYRPADSLNPLSVYGQTKAEGEIAAGPSATILRTSWVYSEHGSNFAKTMLRLMGERDTLSVVADQIGCPTHASSLALTIWAMVADPQAGIFHFSDAGAASWYDFAVAIAEEAHEAGLIERIPQIFPIATTQYPTAACRPAFSLLDSSATRSRYGIDAVHWRTPLRPMIKGMTTLG